MTIITVEKGDSLYNIGRRYGLSAETVAGANGVDPEKYLVAGDSLIIPAPQEKWGALEVNGYAYPFIDRSVLKKTLPYLTYLSIFSWGARADGTLIPAGDDEDLISETWSAGAAPVLVLTTVDESGGFSSERAARLLADPAAQSKLAMALKDVMDERDYYALDVDMEYIPGALAEQYEWFIRLLRARVEPHPVFVSLAPKTSAQQRGLLYEAHNYAALGAAADKALVMSYEWGYTYSRPQAVAPLPSVEKVIDYAVSEIPPEKILMGVPNYGYDWRIPFEKGTPARSIGNYEAVALARKYGAEIFFDEQAQTPTFTYYDRQGQQHEVWFEDARSYQAKLALANAKGLSGVSVWNVMRFFQPLYTLLDGLFEIVRIPHKETE